MSFDWTEVAVTRMRALWDANLSCARIGREIGLSKSAIIGKVSRLGWSPRTAPIVRLNEARPIRRVSTRLSSEQNRRAALSVPAPDPVVASPSSSSGCQWIEGAPSRHAVFCGAPVQHGSSYCAEHHARCWIARPMLASSHSEIGPVPMRDGRADDRRQAFLP